MDLLKDITRGLRGNGETRRDDRLATADSRRDPDPRSSVSDASDSPDDNRDGETNDAETRDAETADRDDEQVCPFCATEFDADRGVCPECDAEIILRGER